MPGWLVNLLIGIAFSAIAALLRPKPQPPAAGTLDDFNIPRTEEGAEIGKIYGTVLIKNPQVADYGDFDTVPIRSRTGKK